MVNETNNTLLIRGSKRDVNDFIKLHKTDIDGTLYWDFRKSVPCEREQNTEQWGTRRLGTLNSLDYKNGIVMFQTPSTPCFIWFEKIVEKYPSLNFSHYYSDEFQEEFYGWAVAYNGNILDAKQICLHTYDKSGGIDLYKYESFQEHVDLVIK